MSIFPDFSNDEIKIVSDTLAKRYGESKDLQVADVVLRISKDDCEFTERPSLYWTDGVCHFLIAKLGPFHYHNQFFIVAMNSSAPVVMIITIFWIAWLPCCDFRQTTNHKSIRRPIRHER